MGADNLIQMGTDILRHNIPPIGAKSGKRTPLAMMNMCIEKYATLCNRLVLFFCLATALFAISCSRPVPTIKTGDMDSFPYPSDKVWAHKCNDTVKAQNCKERYPGLEVDVVYSSYQDELFVGHELWDTISGLTLSRWFAAIEHPEEICYWLDVKNMDTSNAAIIGEKIVGIGKEFNTLSHLFVESREAEALSIVHRQGIHVLYWVQEYHGKSKKAKRRWMERIVEDVRLCHPVGISCSHEMYPVLNESFPNVNVHYWNTPITDFEANKRRSEELRRVENVKVVLVDYE